MPAMESEERCGVLMALFQTIINDMKENAPAFEDLANKTTKLHSSLRATIASTTVFLEAFQRVADVATNSRGATKEIGKALTRLCLRQRSIESKLKTFTSTLLERLVVPLQETVAEWQKAVVQLDKDHARECKKARADIKRASGDTVRLQRKAKKGKSDAKERLESAMQGVSDMYTTLEESEKKHVRLALIQERKQFCHFITCVDPIVAAEVSMINEAMHLQEILDSLCSLAADPDNLPEASEHVIADASRADIKLTTTFQSPPGSPASLVRSSRRSSLSSLSSMASASEADSAIGVSPNHGSGQKISHGSDGDLLGDQSSLSSKHSSYHSGGRGSAAGAIGTAAAADEVFDSVSLHVPLVMGGQYQQRSLDRPHTISAAASNGLLGEMVARQQYSNRPSLQADTFVPLQPSQPSISAASAGTGTAEQTYATSHSRTPSPVMLVPPSPAAVMMPPPPKPSRGVLRRDTVHGTGGAGGTHRNLPPRVIRAKPVALPSVPFMASEPVYMNTQELAARIAEKRHASELQQQSLQQQQYEATHQTAADRKSSVDQPQSYHHQQQQQVAAVAGAAAAAAMRSSAAVQPDQNTNPGTALANAIKELEASTAALNDACDGADQLPPPPDSLNVAQSRASVDEDQLRPLREVGYAKRVPEAGATADHAVHLTDHDALRIAQGRPVLTSAGPAVLRRTASIKPPPPMRKSSSVTSPRSLEAEYVPKGVSLAGSVTSIPSAAAPNATGAATSQAAEPVRPGSAGLSATPAIDGAAAAAAATTTAVVRRSADAVDHGGAVTAAIATVAAASVIPSPAADHTDRNSRGSTPVASAASLPAAGQPPAVAAVKALPPAVAAKAPPPAVAAKPAARRDLGGGSSTGSAVGLPEPASAARPTSVPNGAVASSSGAATAAAAPAAVVAASLPPWERAPAASLPPWERGSAVASAATVAGSGSSATVAAVTVGQGAQQHRESASAPSFSRPGADFIASLGAKLAAGGGTSLGGGGGGDSTPSAASATASASALRSTGVSASAGGAAAAVVGGTTAALPTPHPGALQPAAVAGSEDNLMSQIHTGVKLKRTQTDDRSAPRVT